MGGMGNIRGSIIAAILLTVLPEKLRAVGDYRMLIYAVLLITVMLLTQSQKGRELITKFMAPVRRLIPARANKTLKEDTGND